MIGRIIWFAALAATALVTVFLQLDMQSRRSPDLAALVPEILRNDAQARIAQTALAGEDKALAVAEAERLVRRRPIPAEHLVLLATSQAKAGQIERSAQTIQIAGQRGWREPAAQEAILRLALTAGDEAEAARRYAALFLRAATPDALLEEFGPPILGKPGGVGQKTLVAVVAGGERWQPMFLRRGAQVMPPAAFSAITADSMARGAMFDCAQLAQSIDMLSRRDAAAAKTLQVAAARRCPGLRT